MLYRIFLPEREYLRANYQEPPNRYISGQRGLVPVGRSPAILPKRVRVFHATTNLFVHPLPSTLDTIGGSTIAQSVGRKSRVRAPPSGHYFLLRSILVDGQQWGGEPLAAFQRIFASCSCSFTSPRSVGGTCAWRWCMGNGTESSRCGFRN